MDYAHFQLFRTLWRIAALSISLCLRCLLLLLDSCNLDSTCRHGHCRCNRCQDIAHVWNGCSTTVGVDGRCCRLCDSLNHLHDEHLAVCLVLDTCYLLFLLAFKTFHLVCITLGKGDFSIVSACDGRSLNLHFGLNDVRHSAEDAAHA